MSDYLNMQKALLTNDRKNIENVLKGVANVNALGGSGINILHYYISMVSKLSFNPEDIVLLLIKSGVDVNAQNEKGASPLHFCVAHPNSIITKVLTSNGAIVDIQDEMGNTPLWRAVMNFRGDEELRKVIDELVLSGANPDKENNSGNSPRKMVLRRHENIPKTKQPIEWDLQPHLNW